MSESELKEVDASAPACIAPAANGKPIAYKRCGPGEGMSDPRPGDIVLVRGTGWLGKTIRFGLRMRYRSNEDRALAHWSHAGIIVNAQGHLIEVVPSGVVLTRLENYRAQEYHYVYLDLSAADRARASSYAYSCLRQKYDRLGFVLLTLAVLTGEWFEVPDRGRQGCVALIVRALQRAGVRFARRPTDMTPADLARNFGVMP
ncbi:MAG: Permuted papain-like amidase enzyme YaeF/YiiX, family [Bradyrhizobium sp.]|nr:Permuted papain-like amidase enzyme YaeF/YiiX, family [Bradyrhizobium sp.]